MTAGTCVLPAQELHGPCEGYLCIKQAWPSTIRTIYGDQERFETTYFAPFKARPTAASPVTCLVWRRCLTNMLIQRSLLPRSEY